MAQRRHYGGAFKTRVVVEALAGHKTVNEIASAYEIHGSLVGTWKSQALARLPEVLSDGRQVPADAGSQREARLYEEIGRLLSSVLTVLRLLSSGLWPTAYVPSGGASSGRLSQA